MCAGVVFSRRLAGQFAPTAPTLESCPSRGTRPGPLGKLAHIRDSVWLSTRLGSVPTRLGLPRVVEQQVVMENMVQNNFPISRRLRYGAVVPLAEVVIVDDLHGAFEFGGALAAGFLDILEDAHGHS